MSVCEDNFACEIEQVIEPSTLVPQGWKYNVYRIRRVSQLLHSGTAGSREAAEAEGRRAVQHAIRQESKSAA